MAKYMITWSCGHQTEKQLFGKETDRQRYIAWAREAGVCEACRARDAERACEAVEEEHQLPALTGSEKQIAWGRKIRAEKIAAISEWVAGRMATVPAQHMEQVEAQVAVAMQALAAQTTARYWIDAREMTARQLGEAALKEARS